MIIMLKCGTLALPDDVDQSGADPIKYVSTAIYLWYDM